MFSNFSLLGDAFASFANLHSLVYVLGATLLGIIIGALPGLTATMGVALMTTLTYRMDHNSAILVLICIYVGAIYGGSRSAILLNIPGTPASACSTLDGFPLARKGMAGRAMGISTSGSWLGTLFGKITVSNSFDDFEKASVSDPDIPTQHHKTRCVGSAAVARCIREIECDQPANVATPSVQFQEMVVCVRGEFEIIGC